MDSLLVCTDFSNAASHAARYACMLALQNRLTYITLFHACHPVAPGTALPLDPQEEDEQSKASLQQLKALKEQLELQSDDRVLIRIRAGKVSLGENINELCCEENGDMVVIGMRGRSGMEKSIGSNAVRVAENSKYPLLVVPGAAPFKPVSHILFACDLGDVTATTSLESLDKVMDLFKANLTVLHVDEKNRHFSPQTPDEVYQLHHVFNKYKPRYACVGNKDVTAGILDHAAKNNISLIVTIPRNYNFFQQLFQKSASQKLMYQSGIPILILHEK